MAEVNPLSIGPKTIVYDSENDYELFILGDREPGTKTDQRFRTRLDDSWWLLDIYGDPVRDEFGCARRVARFEIGIDGRYQLGFHPTVWQV